MPPIASTRREQSAGPFREALRRFVWKRQGGVAPTNQPPLHRRRWQNTVYGRGLRSPGGDSIVCAPRVAFRMPRPGGGRVTLGKLLLVRKVGHHEYVPSAPQSSDHVRCSYTHSNKIYFNRLSLGTRFDTLSPIQPEIYNL